MLVRYFQNYQSQLVNERAVRSTTGILFAIGFSTFWYVFLTRDFTPLYVVVPAFWGEFILKVTNNTRFSPLDLCGELLVSGQKPEPVSLAPKLFAWSMGLAMSSVMLVLVFNQVWGWAPLLVCGSCLLFMWLEAVCGFCVGCVIYRWLNSTTDRLPVSEEIHCAGRYCKVDG